MIDKNRRIFIYRQTVSLWAHEGGAVLVELALVLPLLALSLVYATDYGLERLAEAQIQAATIAAAEFAQVKGCNPSGIEAAALSSLKSGYPWLASNINVTTDAVCECGFLTGTPDYIDGEAPQCNVTCDGSTPAQPFVSIGVTGRYSPLFPMRWFNVGPQTISNGAHVRTRDLGMSCEKQ